MAENLLLGLASIIVLGIGAEWLAWRLRLPSILLLLIFGFIAGPITGFLNPDLLLGDLLLPIVSLSVAIILFEGGLNLRIAELRKIGGVVRNLITVGVLVTWVIGAFAAYYVLNLDFALALLLGAILVVTGPTVIVPLLRYLRPSGQVGSILKWEGIVIDPVGAILAVLVFEAIVIGGTQEATTLIVLSLVKTAVFGGIIGVLGALIVVLLLRRYWVPDFLHSVLSLMVVIAAFTASNLLQRESGLLAATVMGIVLANQKTVSVRHIAEFKENLRVLLISGLFILLAARLQVTNLAHISISSLVFLMILMLIARPASVALSTLRSKLSWRERLFISGLAPRGIVAAAIASVFALRLVEAGYAQAELLIPLTFVVIVGTVAIYGLSASPMARWLKVAEPNPQGVMIVGGHVWARAIAQTLQQEDYKVLVVDANWANISAARMADIPTFYANILSQYALDEIELSGIGHLMALTPDDEFNSLVIMQYGNVFGRAESYQLPSEGEEKESKRNVSQHLRGRILFGSGMTYTYLAKRFASGAVLKATNLTSEFGYEAFSAYYGDTAVPLFLIDGSGKLVILTADNAPAPRTNQRLISLVDPVSREE
ncbi:MAG: sodium:proton antiporter [Dehalococcoidia bacterium]|nr:MAG: sodium:proton antiporter [Dehalococcoidia bacterium]